MKKRNRKVLIQFAEYMVSGGVYFWVGYALLDYLYYAAHWSLWWATIVSNIAGWSVNFILQRYWAFNNKSLKSRQTEVTTKYIFITLVDFLLNYFILYGLKMVGITPAIG
jgi:putative flippase GtrA